MNPEKRFVKPCYMLYVASKYVRTAMEVVYVRDYD